MTRDRWEYKVHNFDFGGGMGGIFIGGEKLSEEMEKQLNELGHEGWELVHLNTVTSYTAVLKRKTL